MKYRLLLPAGDLYRLIMLAAFLTIGAALAQKTETALAQTATPVAVTDDQVNAVASELFCPECENIPLDVCPSQACADMRQEIREKLQLGWTKSQIKQYYIQRYGDRVVGAPPARGFSWLLYIIPPVAILVAILILYRAFRSWKRSPPQPAQGPTETHNPPTVADDYVARLEAELKKAKK